MADPLFDPSLVGKREIMSLPDAIHLAITSCEADRKQLLFENIVLTGGISLIKGKQNSTFYVSCSNTRLF